MLGRRAKILSSFDVGDLLAFASCTRHPLRNAVMVLLSAKAGLRAGEIANLTWSRFMRAPCRSAEDLKRRCRQRRKL
jgi:integrase/recombinase XerD